MKSLYDKEPENWDKIAEFGYPEFRDVAKTFARYCDMDDALGLIKASGRWAKGLGMPSMMAAKAAREFLEAKKSGTLPDVPQKAARPKKTESQMILVSGPEQALKKLEGIAKMLGCESVEI